MLLQYSLQLASYSNLFAVLSLKVLPIKRTKHRPKAEITVGGKINVPSETPPRSNLFTQTATFTYR